MVSGLSELPAVFDPTEEQAIVHRTDVAMSGNSLVHRGTLDGRAREVLTAALISFSDEMLEARLLGIAMYRRRRGPGAGSQKIDDDARAPTD